MGSLARPTPTCRAMFVLAQTGIARIHARSISRPFPLLPLSPAPLSAAFFFRWPSARSMQPRNRTHARTSVALRRRSRSARPMRSRRVAGDSRQVRSPDSRECFATSVVTLGRPLQDAKQAGARVDARIAEATAEVDRSIGQRHRPFAGNARFVQAWWDHGQSTLAPKLALPLYGRPTSLPAVVDVEPLSECGQCEGAPPIRDKRLSTLRRSRRR